MLANVHKMFSCMLALQEEWQESDDEDEEAKERRRRDEEERQREMERARAIQATSMDASGPMKIRTDYVPKRECFYEV